MRSFLLLFRRELAAVFFSLWTYVFIAIVAGLIGWWYHTGLTYGGRELSQALGQLYGLIFWLTIILAPLLTMRSFVDEKRSGSLELLMTAPVSDTVVVLSKISAAIVSYAVFLTPLWLIYAVLGFIFKCDTDWGQLASFTIGLLSLGSVFLSFGVLSSAAAGNHLFAGLMAILGQLFLTLPSMIKSVVDPETRIYRVIAYLDFSMHLRTSAIGVLDLRHLALNLTISVLFAFWTIRLVEARRWL